MTVNEVKKMIKNFQAEENNPFEEMIKENIFNQLKNEYYFFVDADKFFYQLRINLSQKQNLPISNIKIRKMIKNIDYKNSNSFFYHVKLFLEIKTNNLISKQNFCEILIKTRDDISENAFDQNLFKISLLPILLNKELKNKEIIYETCWLMIENQLTYCFGK